MFSLQHFPQEPALALLSDTALSNMVREHSLTARLRFPDISVLNCGI